MSKRTQIIAIHQQHPEWHGEKIAAAAKTKPSYVRSVAQRENLKIPRKPYRLQPEGSVVALGEACKRAGLTLKDIHRISQEQPGG